MHLGYVVFRISAALAFGVELFGDDRYSSVLWLLPSSLWLLLGAYLVYFRRELGWHHEGKNATPKFSTRSSVVLGGLGMLVGLAMAFLTTLRALNVI